jgi:hypothetical protein
MSLGQVTPRADHVGVLQRLTARILLPSLAVMVVALGIAEASAVPVTNLLRDPSSVLDGAWYVGLFSNTAMALWACTAAVCLLALAADPPQAARSLLVAGAVTSIVLGADDGYVIHETLENTLGVPSPVILAVYGVVAVVLFLPVRRHLLSKANVSVFFVALAFLAASALLDFAGETGLPVPPLSAITEDVLKYLGIVSWLTFFSGVARDVIRQTNTT